jgi:hypothetical protein
MMDMEMGGDMDAKLAKIADLKELIYDMLAEGTSETEIMDEIKDAVSGEDSEAVAMEKEVPLDEMADDLGGDELNELQKMKRAYFKPKPAAPRNGTGVFIAAVEKRQPGKSSLEMPMKSSKMQGKMR